MVPWYNKLMQILRNKTLIAPLQKVHYSKEIKGKDRIMKNNRVFIKIKLNNKLEITETGYLQADYLLKQLIENEHITKKCDNVMLRLDNMLYDGVEIDNAYLDLENEYIILNLKTKLKY